MIELNCSYEESKKIFELGYDFSKVCWKSLYEYRDQYNLNQTFIRIHLHGTGLSLTSIEDEISYRMSKYRVVGLVIPIIPKAALEACLPLKLDDCYCISLQEPKIIKKCFFRSMYEVYVKSKYYDDQLYLDFNNAYELFLWLHENYPEELKKRFDEVMA